MKPVRGITKLHSLHGQPIHAATRPPAPGQPTAAARPGLGDLVEKWVKPAAKLLQRAGVVNCLDERHNLRPKSKCAKRKARLNKLGKKLGL